MQGMRVPEKYWRERPGSASAGIIAKTFIPRKLIQVNSLCHIPSFCSVRGQLMPPSLKIFKNSKENKSGTLKLEKGGRFSVFY